MSKETNVVAPSFLTLLGLLFIALKLMGYINWSWWVILAPIWIPIFIGFSVLLGIVLFAFKNEKNMEKK